MGAKWSVGQIKLNVMRSTGQITLAAVGKLRRRQWQDTQRDYQKRIKRFTQAKLVEVKDSVGKGFPDSVAMQREGEQLLQATQASSRRFLLTPDGKEMSSEKFAIFLGKQLEVYGSIAFLIGGPLGFSDQVVQAVDGRISLSRLTFPHELARILFWEQLYRAFTILNRVPYHK